MVSVNIPLLPFQVGELCFCLGNLAIVPKIHDELLSDFEFKVNMRLYTEAGRRISGIWGRRQTSMHVRHSELRRMRFCWRRRRLRPSGLTGASRRTTSGSWSAQGRA